MRLQWLWLLAAPAILGSVFVPWGDKHIENYECETTWDPTSSEDTQKCSSNEWTVSYRPFSLQTTHTFHGTVGDIGNTRDWAYYYTDDGAPHAKAITPLLKAGGLALALGACSMVITGITHQIVLNPRSLLWARIGWAAYAGASGGFLLGMAIHAGTWRAEVVDHLTPGLGALLGTIPLLAGVPLLPVREANQGLPSLPTGSEAPWPTRP